MKSSKLEIFITRLNPRCPELKGAANPNQVHYYRPDVSFHFVDRAGRGTENLGQCFSSTQHGNGSSIRSTEVL